jgi:hypothetical protein
MQNQLLSFLKGVDKAACQWFGEYGGALDALGFALAVTPEPLSTKVGVGLMLANAAAEQGCEYDPNKTGTPIGEGDVGVIFCYHVKTDGQTIYGYRADGTYVLVVRENATAVEITRVWRPTPGEIQFTTRNSNGTEGGGRFSYGGELYIGFGRQGDNCLASREPDDPEPIEPPTLPPVTYKDEDNGCEMNITFKGYAEGPAGSVYQITQIEPSENARASGGVIGGCFFNPTIIVKKVGGGGDGGGGGDDPPITIPVPVPDPGGDDGDDEDWWVPYVKAALGGVVAGATEELIENLLNQPYSSMIYRAVSVCEKNAEGEPISEAIEIPIPALKAPDAQIARLDAIAELLQAHKNFKQPVCENERPILEGDWRTISFRSESTSPYGKSRLRKRFRYRSLSGIGLGELVDHWRDFTFESGPVCVSHKGHPWGTPQVWAATADEGKRVIQHAAREAGFDADQVGGWVVSSSVSARYGVSDTMKVDTKGGYFWITARDGSDRRPVVAYPSDP